MAISRSYTSTQRNLKTPSHYSEHKRIHVFQQLHYNMAEESMTCVPKTARGKISLAHGIHCRPNILYLSCPTSVSILWRMRAHTHIWLHKDRNELPLLPNNTASETLLHKPEAVLSVEWVFFTGVPAWWWLDEYVTLDKTFYKLLFKQEVVASPHTSTFCSLSHS